MALSKQSRHIQEELTKHETLVIANKTDGKLKHKNAMLMDKLSQSLEKTAICGNVLSKSDSSSLQEKSGLKMLNDSSADADGKQATECMVNNVDEEPMDITIDESTDSVSTPSTSYEPMDVSTIDKENVQCDVDNIKLADKKGKTSSDTDEMSPSMSMDVKPKMENSTCNVCSDVLPEDFLNVSSVDCV